MTAETLCLAVSKVVNVINKSACNVQYDVPSRTWYELAIMLWEPVCPARVNGFSFLFLEKPFTLPGRMDLSQKSIMFH